MVKKKNNSFEGLKTAAGLVEQTSGQTSWVRLEFLKALTLAGDVKVLLPEPFDFTDERRGQECVWAAETTFNDLITSVLDKEETRSL